MNGIILSAGLGTRLRPYTDKIPKPSIPFLTVPLLCYPLSLFEKIKFNNLVFNTHHLPEKVMQTVARVNWPANNTIFSNEKGAPLGSGGGIRHAIDDLVGKNEFLVANADEVILPNQLGVIEDALQFHRWHKGIATILVIRHPEVGKRFGGVWVKKENQVSLFSKAPVAAHQGYHFIGIMILADRIRDYFSPDDAKEENILYETLTNAMEKGERAFIHEIQAKWFETGNAADFISATDICLKSASFKNPEYWVEYLKQVIRLHSINEFFIEKDYPEILHQLKVILPKWKSGEL